jgi:maltose O-acetyltransferase
MRSTRSSVYLLTMVGNLLSLLPENRLFRLKALIYAVGLGLDIDGSAHICSSVKFRTYPIHIGARTHIGPGCTFYGSNGTLIFVGKDCDFAPEVILITGTHAIGSHDRRAGVGQGLPIEIGDGCWIGTRVIILPGVTIGAGSIIAAGAVVTQSVAPDSLYAGIPAVLKRKLL